MFQKLRKNFILTNMAITTVVVVFSFGSIYGYISHYVNSREIATNYNLSIELREVYEAAARQDREEYLSELGLVFLITAGIIELTVALISYNYSAKAIAPVRNAYLQQKEFIANASHELKTPIAAARANFEALNSTDEPWASNVDRELDRAAELINDLLLLAKNDEGIGIAPSEWTDLSELIKELVVEYEVRLDKQKIYASIPERQLVRIKKGELVQVLKILLENAIKYSDTKIWLKLEPDRIVVKNNGKVIPEDKLEKVFNRFYQVNKTNEGSGLGLAIAKSIAMRNNWKLYAKSSKNTTSFIIKFI